jgi:hypothetical protein
MLLTNQQKVLKRIQEDVILVKLGFKQPGKSKKSERLAVDTAKSKGIDVASVSTSLVKLKGDNLARYAKLVGEARKFLNYRSCAYDDNGWRLVRLKFWPGIDTHLKELQLKASETADKIVDEDYDSMLEDAKTRLRSEFEWTDFPSRDELKASFGFIIERDVVKGGDDIRLNHTAAVVKDMEHELNQRLSRKVSEARTETVSRIEDVLTNCVDTLSAYGEGKKRQEAADAKIARVKKVYASGSKAPAEEKAKARQKVSELEEARKKFRVRNNGSSINNIKELVTVFKEINITADPNIEALGDKMAQVFEKFDAEKVKNDAGLRKKATDSAKSILDDLRNISLVS